MNPLQNIRIVLVEPQSSGNIGSVCRAMMNMGLTDLAIINPHERHDWDEVRKLACHADSVLNVLSSVVRSSSVSGHSLKTKSLKFTSFSGKLSTFPVLE